LSQFIDTFRWREVLLLLLGSLNRYDDVNTELVKRILALQDEFEQVLYRNLFFVARVLADKVLISAVLKDWIVNSLFELIGSNKIAKWDAFEWLSLLLDDNNILKGMWKVAMDENIDTKMRYKAAYFLGQHDYKLESILSLLLSFSSNLEIEESIRRDASSALGQLGWVDEAWKALFSLVCDENNTWVRRSAAINLIELNQRTKTRDALLSLAQDEKKNSAVRVDAIFAMGEMGELRLLDTTFLESLLVFASDKKLASEFREAAIQALGTIMPTDSSVHKRLLDIATDKKEDVKTQKEAAMALATLGYVDIAVNVLIGLTRNKKLTTGERGYIAQNLGFFGKNYDEIGPALISLAKDISVNGWVRCYAARSLKELGYIDDAIEVQLELLKNQSNQVRSVATVSLGQLGKSDGTVITALLELAQDKNEPDDVRESAAWSLQELGIVDKAIHTFLSLVENEQADAQTRLLIIERLANTGRADDAVIKSLLAMASNEKEKATIRINASEALGRLGYVGDAIRWSLILAHDEDLNIEERRTVYYNLKSMLGTEQKENTSFTL
jgi:hypothetical protein